MTDQPQKGAPARNAGRSLLGALVADPERFAADVWSRCPLHCPAAALPGTARALFSAEAVDELVSTRGLRTPFLRMARNGATLADRDFTAPGGAGATIADQLSDDKLLQQFADGATMVLQGLHRTWEPLIAFSQGLAGELGHPVQVNGYVTPAQSRGFDDHYDVHDVFVLQIDGEKEWTIHAPVLEAPLRSQPWTDRRSAVEAEADLAPLIKTVLAPGDCLYLPRGYLHAAQALGGISTHLTIGVQSWTRYHLAEQLSAAALSALTRDVEARTSLPFGVEIGDDEDLGNDLELVRSRLIEAVRTVPAEQLATALATEARGTQRAAPVGPIQQLRAAHSLNPDTQLRLRDYLQATIRLDPAGSTGSLTSRAGRLDLSADEIDPMRALLRDGSASVSVLGIELSRRLLRAAVAVPSD